MFCSCLGSSKRGGRGLDARVSSADGVAAAFELILPQRAAVGDAMLWSRDKDSDTQTDAPGRVDVGGGASSEADVGGCSAERRGGTKHALLSNHFFLDDYGLHGGTESLVYAVVGRSLDRTRPRG